MNTHLHKFFFILSFALFYSFCNAQTTLLSSTINNGGFESGNAGWTRVNAGGANADKWFVGIATSFAGTQSAYISNDGGTSNIYTGGNVRVQHVYRSITFPAGEPYITLTFKWKCEGEGSFSDWDNLKVFISTTTPTAGTENAVAAQVGSAWYNFQTTWQTATITLPTTLAGTTSNLIFQWKCDGFDAYDPPGAIDDITLISSATPPVSSGCTTNTTQFPSSTFTPNCDGTVETITSAGYATEYSVVSVTSGTPYVFSSDISSDYLTIANTSGGTPVYAFGTTPVSWTATFTGTVRVYNNTNSSCGTNASFRSRFVQCGTIPSPPANDNCIGAIAFPVIPTNGICATLANQSTAGATNSSVTPTSACTSNSGTPNDVWFSFVATASNIILNASWVSGVTDVYWQVFSGSCASSMTSILCTDNNSGGTLTGLSIGQTYYVRMYAYFGGVTAQTICLQTPPPPPSNDECAGAIAFPAIPNDGSCASLLNQSSQAALTSNVTPSGACTTNYGTPDDDVWFSFVATSNTINFTATFVSNESDVYWQVFSGTCNTTMNALVCTDNNAGALISGLTIGQTYYIRMYSYYSGSIYTVQSLCLTNPCPGGAPNNDLPCNAISIPLGTIASGNNGCSSNIGEPATPSCWTTGNANTVWYSFIAPASGSVKIRTAPGTLTQTQIAVYSGTCGATLVQVNCNDDAPDCGGTTLNISELSLTGLTNGATYYIAVDGENDLFGTFAITAVNGNATYPSSSGQECVAPITVCNSIISVGDPGYQGIGFTCDNTNSSTTGTNCTTGERGSAWYKIIIDNPGTLYFNIVPNDYDGISGNETDYDFLLWKISGSGSTTCAALNTNGGANSVACNYSYLGVTGLAPSGNSPAPYGSGFDAAYEAGVSVAAGDIYYLAVQNFSNSTSGFTLDFSNTASGVVNYGTPASVTWTGGANTTIWNSNINWGGCTIPTCGINAIVSPSSSFQPTITSAMGTVLVRNITIDPGATLTLGANSVLRICESLYNNGTIIAHPTSTIIFSDDNTTHSLNGTLSGSSQIGNLTITDVAGSTNCSVIANTNLQLAGNFTTSNPTSIFNLNNRNLTIAGNLINASGATTFTNTPNSTITFNGSTAQIYSPNQNTSSPILTLNNVVMNQTGAGVSISTTNTPNMVLGTSGQLTLTLGKIITPNLQEVILTNTATNAVTAGNVNSYIEGNLRRFLAANATGSFDFPVGHAIPGYERANVNFASAASISAINLLARFDPWGGAWLSPSPLGVVSECGILTYNAPYLDNGYWTLNSSAISTGNYTLTLYNRGYSNVFDYFTIAKSPSSSPSWSLNGNCVLGNPVTAVQRTAMFGFSKFATMQNSLTLPVELIYFNGKKFELNVQLSWSTASEKNSDYFIVEHSIDGIHFTEIGNLKAAGYSDKVLNYEFIDWHPEIGNNYYRLKQVDIDESVNFSRIIIINFSKDENQVLVSNIYPNPVLGKFFLEYNTPIDDNLTIVLYDNIGRELRRFYRNVTIGSSLVQVDIDILAQGIYILKLVSENNGYTFIKKIHKQ